MALTRSELMARVKSKNTKPELFVRSFFHRSGLRFRLHCKNLPGKPDIVFTRKKIVVFVHGCFWHRHEDCQKTRYPKSRVDFWQSKFESNIKNDRAVQNNLKKLGWNAYIIWECCAYNTEYLANIVASIKQK